VEKLRALGEVRCTLMRVANGPKTIPGWGVKAVSLVLVVVTGRTMVLETRAACSCQRLLEPYDVKVSSTVLRGGKGRNALPLPDVRHEAALCE